MLEKGPMSLYDYLGRAAGGELGKAVAEAAAQNGEFIQTRVVENKVYSGKVCLYREEFLDWYFREKKV